MSRPCEGVCGKRTTERDCVSGASATAQVDAAVAVVSGDGNASLGRTTAAVGTTAVTAGAGATDCPGCRPGSHKAHTCGKSRPRGCKRTALQALNHSLEFEHPGQRMRCNSCNSCLEKDQQLAQKDGVIARLKRERDELKLWVEEHQAQDISFCEASGEEQDDDEDGSEDEEELAEGGDYVADREESWPAIDGCSSDSLSVRAFLPHILLPPRLD